MDNTTEQRANDLLQALAMQRNKHADEGAGIFADLLAAKRRIAELEKNLEDATKTPAEDVAASSPRRRNKA